MSETPLPKFSDPEKAAVFAATYDLTTNELKEFFDYQHNKQERDIERMQGVIQGPLREMTPEQFAKFTDSLLGSDEFGEVLRGQYAKTLAQDQAKKLVEQYNSGATGINLVSDEDILKRPKPEWWVDGLIQKGTIAELAGPGGLGKSFLCLHIARCVATGLDAFGLPVSTGRVLYVAAEGGSAFGVRASAWDAAHLISPPAGSISYVESGVLLASRASIDQLREVIREGEFDLVILDTFSQLSGISNENDAAQTAEVYRNLKHLRDAREGCTVLVVHHTNADGKARGSSVHRNNVDTLIIASGDSKAFSLSTEDKVGGKQKDAEAVRYNGFSLEAFGPSAVIRYSGKAPVSPWWEPIKIALSDGEWHKTSELRDACGIPGSGTSEYDQFKTFLYKHSHGDGKLLYVEPSGNSNRYKIIKPLVTAV